MKSHTIPKNLIEQFAYADPITGSKRLWRYQKGQPPYGRATPKAATRCDGHFADPTNSAKESELEERLAQEFEDPVNQFIDMLGYRTFVLTNTHNPSQFCSVDPEPAGRPPMVSMTKRSEHFEHFFLTTKSSPNLQRN